MKRTALFAAEQFPEFGMLAERIEVGVDLQVGKIVIPEQDGPRQGVDRVIGPPGPRITSIAAACSEGSSNSSLTLQKPVGRMATSEGGGPELYLELRRGGAPIDPVRWLAAR